MITINVHQGKWDYIVNSPFTEKLNAPVMSGHVNDSYQPLPFRSHYFFFQNLEMRLHYRSYSLKYYLG